MKVFVGDTEISNACVGNTQPKIFEGDTQVRPQTAPTEYIEYEMNGYNSNLYVPTRGVDTDKNYASYDWYISIDGGTPVRYTGTASSSGYITLSGYTTGTRYNIKITPVTEDYGWARAYCWGSYAGSGSVPGTSVSGSSSIKDIVYDGSYMGYAVSATNTGNYFRYYQYKGLPISWNIVPPEVLPNTVTTVGDYFRSNQYKENNSTSGSVPDEVLPDSVTTIGSNFRSSQYSGSKINTNLQPVEVLSNSVTTIGDYFRSGQYYGTNIGTPKTEVLTSSVTTIGEYFRYQQYANCKSLTTTATEVGSNSVTTIGNRFRYAQYQGCTALTTAGPEGLFPLVTDCGSVYRGRQFYGCTKLNATQDEGNNVYFTTIGTSFRLSQYYGCSALTTVTMQARSGGGTDYRSSQFSNAGKSSATYVTVYGDILEASRGALNTSKVVQVAVPSGMLSEYQASSVRNVFTLVSI